MKWYNIIPRYRCCDRLWYTHLDDRGRYFEIRENGKRFDLYSHQDYIKSFGSLQAAMDAAETI